MSTPSPAEEDRSEKKPYAPPRFREVEAPAGRLSRRRVLGTLTGAALAMHAMGLLAQSAPAPDAVPAMPDAPDR